MDAPSPELMTGIAIGAGMVGTALGIVGRALVNRFRSAPADPSPTPSALPPAPVAALPAAPIAAEPEPHRRPPFQLHAEAELELIRQARKGGVDEQLKALAQIEEWARDGTCAGCAEARRDLRELHALVQRLNEQIAEDGRDSVGAMKDVAHAVDRLTKKLDKIVGGEPT